MKKVLIFALTICLLLSCVPVVALAQDTQTQSETPTELDSSNFVSAITADPTGNFVLVDNIDLGGTVYNNYIFETFNGTLDGTNPQGGVFEITGFSFASVTDNDYDSNCGVFAKIGESGNTVIKNLKIGTDTNKIQAGFWAHGTPAIIGMVAAQHVSDEYSVLIENVDVYANITEKLAKSKVYIGGIIGHSSGTQIVNCTVNGSILGDGRAANETSVGGFVGISYGATIIGCINNADININQNNNYIRGGGFVGIAAKNTYIQECVNFGDITIPGIDGRNLSNGYLGGLIGINQCTASNGYVKNSSNLGNITVNIHTNGATAAYLIGGIAGSDTNSSVYENCINYGAFENKNNTGTINGVCASKGATATFTGCFDATATPDANAHTSTAGVQDTTPVSNAYNVRAVASVDSLDYVNVGFAGIAYWVDANGNLNTWSFRYNCSVVYKNILGMSDSGVIDYKASDFGGNYLMALSFEGVPADADVTINFTSFAETAEGVFVYGQTSTASYADGENVSLVNVN